MVRYYGYYSNVSQRLRQNENYGTLILFPSMGVLYVQSDSSNCGLACLFRTVIVNTNTC
jgi:hypothetical protein